MGGASSSILVHGFSWLYGSPGGDIELQEIVNGLINTQMYNSLEISIALIFITVGIGSSFPQPLLINGLLTYTKKYSSFDKFLPLYLSLRCEAESRITILFMINRSILEMLHSWFSSFRGYECNRSIRRQKDQPKMIISWLLRTNQIR
ncbi:hypothetical protein Gohar_016568, partial [Gossypium harknessii]|nr:hypothetical protein [Gossypium harknessii]